MGFTIYGCFIKEQNPKTKWYFHVVIIFSVARDEMERQSQGEPEACPCHGFGPHLLPRLHLPIGVTDFLGDPEEEGTPSYGQFHRCSVEEAPSEPRAAGESFRMCGVGNRQAVKGQRWRSGWLGERMCRVTHQPVTEPGWAPQHGGGGGRDAPHGDRRRLESLCLQSTEQGAGRVLLRSRTPRCRARRFSGVTGNRCAEVPAGRVLVGGPWS